MSFILVLKSEHDSVALLGELVYPTRKEALAALSDLTSDPSFDRWDDEVLVIDLEKGTPVLLVRPAAATTSVEAEVVLEEETESVVVESDDEADEAETAEDVDESDVEPAGSLKDAIARTAAQMEADGISAPESVGPADVDDVAAEEISEAQDAEEDVAAEEEPVDEAWPWAKPAATAPELEAPAAEPEATAAEPAEDEIESTEAEMADEAPAEDVVDEVSAEAEELPAEEAEPGAVELIVADDEVPEADVPVSDEAAAESDFTIADIEAPGVDEGSLVRAAGDDETMAASRPVILGDYDDAPVAEPMSFREGEGTDVVAEAGEPSETPIAADVVESAGVNEVVASDADSEPAPAEVVSDFILDMNPVAGETPSTDEPSGYQTGGAPEMSCSDCVYVNTCPNKGERDPATCGSFQWK